MSRFTVEFAVQPTYELSFLHFFNINVLKDTVLSVFYNFYKQSFEKQN